MLKSLFSLPMAAVMNVRIHIATIRTLRALKRRGEPYTWVDVGYTMAPELVSMFGAKKVMTGIAHKFFTGALDPVDIGIVRWLKENHKVSA